MHVGKPLPPTDFSVYLEDVAISLQWSPPFTLFEQILTLQTPMLRYIVYAYSNQSNFDVWYKRETNSTITNYTIQLNELSFQLCNLSVKSMTFGVSAIFDIVGEGGKSDSKLISFDRSTVETLCQRGIDEITKLHNPWRTTIFIAKFAYTKAVKPLLPTPDQT